MSKAQNEEKDQGKDTQREVGSVAIDDDCCVAVFAWRRPVGIDVAPSCTFRARGHCRIICLTLSHTGMREPSQLAGEHA